MTGKEAQRELERAAAELDKAIEELIERPTAVDQWPATLQTTAAALLKTREQVPRLDAETFAPLIKSIQNRVTRVNLLLESAALFYCGCVAVAAPQHLGYAADGALQQSTSGGRIQLEA